MLFQNAPKAQLPECAQAILGELLHPPEDQVCHGFTVDPLFVFADSVMVDPMTYWWASHSLSQWTDEMKRALNARVRGCLPWDLVPSINGMNVMKGTVLIHKRLTKDAIPAKKFSGLVPHLLSFPVVLALLAGTPTTPIEKDEKPLANSTESFIPVMVGPVVKFIRVIFIDSAEDRRWTLLPDDPIDSIPVGKSLILCG